MIRLKFDTYYIHIPAVCGIHIPAVWGLAASSSELQSTGEALVLDGAPASNLSLDALYCKKESSGFC